jgi:membrane protein YdbS with pleckstrin-like domain
MLAHAMMLAMQVRQSIKMIVLVYILCLLAEVFLGIRWAMMQGETQIPGWAFMPIPVIVAIFAAVRHIQRRMTRISISGDRLRYESGLFSKTTRTMELAKVQDVRVDQSLGQRMINVGDISLETAGGSSRIVMLSIDRPREAADHILDVARAAAHHSQTPDLPQAPNRSGLS